MLHRGYPQNFRFLRPQEQTGIWLKYFPDLDASHIDELAQRSLRRKTKQFMEGWCVIPKPEKIMNRRNGEDFLSVYRLAISTMIKCVTEVRRFTGFQILNNGFRNSLYLYPRTRNSLETMIEKTSGDFLVFPFQFGGNFQGRLCREINFHLANGEFALAPYEIIALMFLYSYHTITPENSIYFERFRGEDNLDIYCLGGKYVKSRDNEEIECYIKLSNRYDDRGSNSLYLELVKKWTLIILSGVPTGYLNY